jgi:hypothetical protein
MRGKKAKKLRKLIYGDMSYRDRKHFHDKDTGQVYADARRTAYKMAKRVARSVPNA